MHCIPNNRAYFEHTALQQLEHCASLPGARLAFAYPDLHPGKGIPVGGTLVTQGHIYPSLIGGDIGCGMSFWKTDFKLRKLKKDVLVRRLQTLESVTVETQDPDLPFADAMGTVGAGNHFVELQQIETIYDLETAEEQQLDSGQLHFLIHSGSRGYGESILRKHVDQFAARGVETNSSDATEFMNSHDQAVLWAIGNRTTLAQKLSRLLNCSKQLVSDTAHNLIEKKTIEDETIWLHRKGAAVADRGLVVIAGSRGTLSYLVQPIDNCAAFAWSISHGAGRKWNRSDSYSRMRHRFRKEQLIQTELGGRVICEDKQLLFEEAPPVYKDIDTVVGHLEQAGLIKIVASMRPLITYKKPKDRRQK